MDLEAAVIARSEYAAVLRVLAKLAPRFERLLRLRYGINCEPHTLDMLAALYGITPERVRQMETSAIRLLRWHLRSLFPRGALVTEPRARGNLVTAVARQRREMQAKEIAAAAARIRAAQSYYKHLALDVLLGIWCNAQAEPPVPVAAIRAAYIAALGTPDELRLQREYARSLRSTLVRNML